MSERRYSWWDDNAGCVVVLLAVVIGPFWWPVLLILGAVEAVRRLLRRWRHAPPREDH